MQTSLIYGADKEMDKERYKRERMDGYTTCCVNAWIWKKKSRKGLKKY